MPPSQDSSGKSDAERRAHTRLPIGRLVEISWAGECHSVALEDVSLAGARVRLPNPPPIGTVLALGDGAEGVSVTVVRVDGDIVGLRFETDAASLGYVIKTVIARPKDG